MKVRVNRSLRGVKVLGSPVYTRNKTLTVLTPTLSNSDRDTSSGSTVRRGERWGSGREEQVGGTVGPTLPPTLEVPYPSSYGPFWEGSWVNLPGRDLLAGPVYGRRDQEGEESGVSDGMSVGFTGQGPETSGGKIQGRGEDSVVSMGVPHSCVCSDCPLFTLWW